MMVRRLDSLSGSYKLPKLVFQKLMAEINLSAVESTLQPAQPFVEITKFPAVSRDIALLLKANAHRSS
ncbi:MAG: hypothetical protein ACLTZB_03575 [Streptococcus salivarius]